MYIECMTELKEFMTIKEVAELFKVHPRTIKRWIEQGKLSRIDLTAQTIRIPKADVIILQGGKNVS